MQNRIKGTFLLKLIISVVSISILIGLIIILFKGNIFLNKKAFIAIGIIIIILWFFIDSGIVTELLVMLFQKKVKIETIQNKRWLRLLFKEIKKE